MKLIFQKAQSQKDIQNVYEYNIDAFSESPDFNWNLKEIQKEVVGGWDLYAAYLGEEVIAAIFLKEENGQLLSKTTSIKMNYQGSGYSHKIKEFIEESAQQNKISEVVNFCGIDNFRMYSLNESHGYKKTGRKLNWEIKIIGEK